MNEELQYFAFTNIMLTFQMYEETNLGIARIMSAYTHVQLAMHEHTAATHSFTTGQNLYPLDTIITVMSSLSTSVNLDHCAILITSSNFK